MNKIKIPKVWKISQGCYLKPRIFQYFNTDNLQFLNIFNKKDFLINPEPFIIKINNANIYSIIIKNPFSKNYVNLRFIHYDLNKNIDKKYNFMYYEISQLRIKSIDKILSMKTFNIGKSSFLFIISNLIPSKDVLYSIEY